MPCSQGIGRGSCKPHAAKMADDFKTGAGIPLLDTRGVMNQGKALRDTMHKA